MLLILPFFSLSWGPILHQTIAETFAECHLTNLTTAHRTAFVLGAIWADGLDKQITHRTSSVIETLRQIGDVNRDVYWFFVGSLCHIAPDTFAHAGKSSSFIVPYGILHSFSELVIDSVMMHRYGAIVYQNPREILAEVRSLNVRVSKWFYPLYRLIVLLARIPLHGMVRFIERDELPHRSCAEANKNFDKHYEAMLQSMREAVTKIWEKGFSDVRMREISTRLVYDIQERNRVQLV
jgi:hypothetical protein